MFIGIAGLIAFAAGAVQLLPSIEYSHRAVRFVGVPAFPASDRIPYYYLHDGVYAHSFLNLLIAPGLGRLIGPFEAVNPYFGVFPLLLSAIGIWKNWGQPWVRYLTGLAAASFLYALGPPSLLHGLSYALIPWLSIAREASRFMYLAGSPRSQFWRPTVWGLYFRRAMGDWGAQTKRQMGRRPKARVTAPLGLRAIYAQPELDSWVSLLRSCWWSRHWLLFRYVTSGPQRSHRPGF